MKICGIIAEYNPFHDGHAYQLKEARRLSGADAVVVVMSGHFVQRGEPAITDPYLRAQAALENGADAVFMMPPKASTASAEGFAAYGVAALSALGCDCISCGIEDTEDRENKADTENRENKAGPQNSENRELVERLKDIAFKLADEDKEMSSAIRDALKNGMSYPAALARAMGEKQLGPNSILAIEYLKAMRRLGIAMEFIPVKRVGSGYNDTVIKEGAYPSASAIRKQILQQKTVMAEVSEPTGATAEITETADTAEITETAETAEIAEIAEITETAVIAEIAETADETGAGVKYVEHPVGADDVMPMIIEAIRNHMEELEDFVDCSPQIAARIKNSRFHYNTFEEMVTDLKTKDVTYTRVARVLTHILLNIRKTAKCQSSKEGKTLYAQLIGFSNSQVLTELSKRSTQKGELGITIISKAADFGDVLQGSAYAAEVYNQALWNKYHIEGKDFFRHKILKI